jgi:hypothetical protein
MMTDAEKMWRELQAESYLHRLIESEATPGGAAMVAGALRGEPGAAGRLVSTVPDFMRGHVVMACHFARIPPREFSEALGRAWSLSHQAVLDAVNNRRSLRAMFKYADCSIPDDLPPVLQVWRGFAGASLAKGKRGLSWTLSRDVACFFAMRWEFTRKHPLVITANVPRGAVLHFSDDRGEAEVILFDVREAAVDGGEADWALRCQAYQSARKVTELRLLSSITQKWEETK